MDLEPTKMPTGELECLPTDLNPCSVGPEDLRIWRSSANTVELRYQAHIVFSAHSLLGACCLDKICLEP